MRTTYTEFMKVLKDSWNYKYHNVPSSVVEPYPVELPPSKIIEALQPATHYDNEKEILQHADYIHSNKHLKGHKPFNATFQFNNSKPYIINIYAHTELAAKQLAINNFSKYMYSQNNPLYKTNLINMGINNGNIILKVKEI